MDRKNIILVVALGIFLILFTMAIFGHNKKDSSIVIIKYKIGTDKVLKKVNINDKKEKTKLETYLDDIKILSEEESVDLVLAKEIEIKYDNNITIDIQLSEHDYCYYTNLEKGIASLARIPDGLYEFILAKTK